MPMRSIVADFPSDTSLNHRMGRRNRSIFSRRWHLEGEGACGSHTPLTPSLHLSQTPVEPGCPGGRKESVNDTAAQRFDV
jgi:hypothetical protein